MSLQTRLAKLENAILEPLEPNVCPVCRVTRVERASPEYAQKIEELIQETVAYGFTRDEAIKMICFALPEIGIAAGWLAAFPAEGCNQCCDYDTRRKKEARELFAECTEYFGDEAIARQALVEHFPAIEPWLP
jgi:hypothetical protein